MSSAHAPAVATFPRARAEQPASQWVWVWRRFRRHHLAILGLVCLVALALLSALGPRLVPYGPDDVSLSEALQPPSARHWFGTDELGRDTLARVLAGGRISMTIGFAVAITSVLLGAIIGAVAGYLGGVVDNALMRVVDVVFTIPRIVLLLVLAKLVGSGVVVIIAILVALEWTASARLARGMVLSLREQPFVEAARSMGASGPRVLFRHVMPNSLGPLIVAATLDAGAAIRAETTLSFLGLGVQPPTASWGNLLTNSSTYFLTAPWQVFFPGAFIFVALMSFNLVGDGLRDALDPRLSQRGA